MLCWPRRQETWQKGPQLLRLFSVMLLAVAAPAWGCKLAASAYDLKAFWQVDNARKVVFIGEVVAVEDVAPPPELERDQRITFLPYRWWLGKPGRSVPARGTIAKPVGTDCDGNWDFTVAKGQRWLIAGYEEEVDGETVVLPSAMLSRRLDGGELPKEIADVLQTPQFTGMPLAAARKSILKSGWKPRPASQRNASAAPFFRAGYREVEICTGTGLNDCIFNYTNLQSCLRVYTAGEQPQAAMVINGTSECPARDVLTPSPPAGR